MSTTHDRSVSEPANLLVKLRDDLAITPDASAEPPGYRIEDPLRNKFYRVGVAEYTFLALLDGRTSIGQATGLAAARLGPQALNEHEGVALCRWALDCQLARPAGSPQTDRLCEAAEKSARRRLAARLNPLLIRIPLVDPDRMLARVEPRLAWVFSWQFAAVWAATCLYAACLLAAGWTHFATSASVVLDRENWLRLAAAWVLLKLLHEFAHGLACKHYGGNVPEAGVSLLFFAPLAYVDVTSSWRLTDKWPRIVTAAAGMVAELAVAAVAVIAWSGTSPGLAHQLAFNLAMMAGFSTLVFNANPLVRFDGYYILADWLEIPNLAPRGQQYTMHLLERHVLGREAALPAWPPRKAWLVKLYAVASLVWRTVFYLTFVLAMIGLFGNPGVLLAAMTLGCGWGVPAVQTIRRLVRSAATQPIDRRRPAMVAAMAVGVLAIGGAALCWPARISAPAVVEYAPLGVLRATTPGFVREIRVASGDVVEAGQVVAVLENKELAAELADLALTARQSDLRARMYYQDEQLAKSQAERASAESLAKKMAELRGRIDALTVRAPARGTVFARNLPSLVGCYLQPGAEIAVVGGRQTKELWIAVAQEDVDQFAAHLGEPVDVRVRGAGRLAARLVKVVPRGSTEVPHPALAAPVGGPLAVKPKAVSREAAERTGETCELLLPAFLAKASLPPETGGLVRAGQMATVAFRASGESVAARWLKSADAWLRRHMQRS